MNCRHAQHLLDSYFDGELPASLRAEVHAHRLTCSECQRAMVVVEVAGDVISSDCPEPDISLGFTDRVIGSLKPQQEPRVARIIRFRRAAAFLGPIVSAAAVWMVVVSAITPVNTVQKPASIVNAETVVASHSEDVIKMASAAPMGSPTIIDQLARGLLSPAVATWQDTQRSTRDLVSLGRYVFSAAGEPFGALSQEEGDEAELSVLLRAENLLMNMLAPSGQVDTIGAGSDML
jgi:hypothetical protein